MIELDPGSVLLVEDNIFVANCLKNAILHYSARIIVDIAPTLANAREKIAQNTYHYWIIDIRLPDGTGEELLSEKSRPKMVLGMSGDTIDYEIQKRFTAYFQNPFDPSRLIPYFKQEMSSINDHRC